MNLARYRPSRTGATCAFAALLVFAADVVTPQGVAESCLYPVVVFAALRSPTVRRIVGLAALCAVLTVVGYFLSPESLEPWKSMVNRAIALGGIATTAMLGLQRERLLRESVLLAAQRELALTRALGSFIPTCAWCKRVRDEHDDWGSLEAYVARNTTTAFTHGICPACEREVRGQVHLAGQGSEGRA